jgi:hypothetical protein
MKLNTKGFGLAGWILLFVSFSIIVVAGYYFWDQISQNNTDVSVEESLEQKISRAKLVEETADHTCTIDPDWKTTENKIYGYEFSYPARYKSSVNEGISGSLGNFVEIADPESEEINQVEIEALLWTVNGEQSGSIGVETDEVRSIYESGGVKELASKSLDLNKIEDSDPNIEKSVGALRDVKLCDSVAWGFDVGGTFVNGFIAKTGEQPVDVLSTIIFVEDDSNVYKVTYPRGDETVNLIINSITVNE